MLVVVLLPFEEVEKLGFGFRRLVGVEGNHLDYFLNHKLFHLFFGLVLELNLELGGVVLAEVRVQPHLDFAVFVDRNVILGDGKSSDFFKQLAEAFQHRAQAVEVVRTGYVLEVAESRFRVFDVDLG